MDIDVVFQSGGEIWLWDGDSAAPDRGRPRRRATGDDAPTDRCQPSSRHHRSGGRRPGQRGRGARHGVLADPPRRPGARPGLGVDGAAAAAGRALVRRRRRLGHRRRRATTPSRCGAPPTRPAERSPPASVGRVLELVAAPDGSLLAGASHDGRLWVVTVATGELREIDRTDNGDITGLAFAPDSRWLAWSRPGPQPLAQIRLAEVADPAATPIDVTPLRFADTEPVVQHRRQLSGLPVDAQLRPDLRRLRVRPVVPQWLPAAAGDAVGDDAVPVRSGRRRAGAGSAQGRTAPPSSGSPTVHGRRRGHRPAGRALPRARRPVRLAARCRRRVRVAAGAARRGARRRPRPPRRRPAAPGAGALRPRRRGGRDAARRRRSVRPHRRRSPPGRRRQARRPSHPRRPQGATRGGGEVRRPRHRRSRLDFASPSHRATSGNRCTTRRDG